MKDTREDPPPCVPPETEGGKNAAPLQGGAGGAVFASFFVGFVLAILIVLRSQPFNDPGALWHIRVGDWIIQHQTFPHTDPFTWSYADQPWIPQQWGAECLISIVHRIGGFDAMLLGMATLLALMAAKIAMRFIDAGLHWMPTAAIVAFGIAVAGFHFYLRPHIATIVLMSVVMAWIVDFDRGKIDEIRLVWMIPLCAVWTNLHGGVLGGIFTYGIALCGWQLSKRPRLRPAGLRLPPILAVPIVLIPCIAVTLLNPFGLDMHRTWWKIVGSSVVKDTITEHQPLSLARTDGQAVVGFGVFYLVMLAGTLPKRPRATWLIPVVWLGLSITSIRHGPLFCVTALVALADLLPETVWFRLLRKYGDTFAREPAASPSRIGVKGWGIVAATMLLSLGLQVGKVPVPVIGYYGRDRLDSKMIPMELIDPLQEYAKSKQVGFPIFNDANLGGFLIYFTPTLKVFMDDRCELYGDAGISDYVDMANDHPERIEDWAKKAPFDRALVESDSAFDRYLKKSKRWKELARCQKAVLYGPAP